ncbi:hypothetical protein A3709_20725 [Halioglobus sp. HI00S01]|uniref:hypothetical protein n=1 Tax=Halioglobus sp. HI00S01 TaxID=1822214 RepID=UPI0007C28308|nr:hypothetical protein [Halioglobus sp. HI00S01]KZX58039.1 hypothetical protein A3709_20725 [Halioglobus sp. HI00S01]
MPYQFVESEVFTRHRGVAIYHTYKHDNFERRVDYWYSTLPWGDESNEFDVRELDVPEAIRGNKVLAIQCALDTGLIELGEDDELAFAPEIPATLKAVTGLHSCYFDMAPILAAMPHLLIQKGLLSEWSGGDFVTDLAVLAREHVYQPAIMLDAMESDGSDCELELDCDSAEIEKYLLHNRRFDFNFALIHSGLGLALPATYEEQARYKRSLEVVIDTREIDADALLTESPRVTQMIESAIGCEASREGPFPENWYMVGMPEDVNREYQYPSTLRLSPLHIDRLMQERPEKVADIVSAFTDKDCQAADDGYLMAGEHFTPEQMRSALASTEFRAGA